MLSAEQVGIYVACHKFEESCQGERIINVLPNLVFDPGGRCNHHPQLANRDYSGTEHLLDLRPVCKLEFVHFCPIEKTQSALYINILFSRCENSISHHLICNIYFLTEYVKTFLIQPLLADCVAPLLTLQVCNCTEFLNL